MFVSLFPLQEETLRIDRASFPRVEMNQFPGVCVCVCARARVCGVVCLWGMYVQCVCVVCVEGVVYVVSVCVYTRVCGVVCVVCPWRMYVGCACGVCPGGGVVGWYVCGGYVCV